MPQKIQYCAYTVLLPSGYSEQKLQGDTLGEESMFSLKQVLNFRDEESP